MPEPAPGSSDPDPDWRVVAVPLTHPDAVRLIEEVQREYVVLYGSRDDSPIDPAELEPGSGAFLVGHLDDVPVATGGWRWHRVVPGVEHEPCAEVKRMYVARTHRRRGLGTRMLHAVEASARAAGAATMLLETGIEQPEAIALYRSRGYVPVPGFGHYRDSPLSRCFAKPLDPARP